MSKEFIRLNNGEKLELKLSYRYTLSDAVVDYVAKHMKRHKRKFTSEELLRAPWMVPQSIILVKTQFCSLEELSDKAWLQAKPRDNSGLTELGKKVVASMRAAKAYAQR